MKPVVAIFELKACSKPNQLSQAGFHKQGGGVQEPIRRVNCHRAGRAG